MKDSESSVTSNYRFEDTGWCKIEGEWEVFFFSFPLAVPSSGLAVSLLRRDNDPTHSTESHAFFSPARLL